jgi:glycosyltransferase involved in cell wall biosynthesis
VIGIPIASLAGVPVRISARRGLWSGIRGKKWLIFSKLSNLFATHFTANSESVSRDVMRFESLPNDKVSIIPNIIQRDDRRANVKLQPARVVVVANLIEYKGHLDLLEAISLTNPKLLFEFVGQGPMLEVLLRRSSDLGINERVKFLGYHPNPIEVMLGAQFGVLPSHSEGLPNAILEAQSVGLPMIATRVGGIPEILHHNWNGFILNPRSPVDLAEAISFMSENPIERNRFSSRSIESLDSYSSKNIVNLYLELYQNLIHSKN